VFKIFLQFQALVERQFTTKIKSVRTDWGGEYRKLNTYFKTIGIHHHLICPHTHEQNGTVERRHRHIVETGLTLRGQCKAPLKFWSYAFETTIYLINRMPTAVLNGCTPFERLFKSSPDYNFLRIFRCLCFPLLRPYNQHKLDFRSSSCVFLGYSSSYLGYCCFDLSSSNMYIAWHVKFHENTFPFVCSEQTTALPSPSLQIALPAFTVFLTPMPSPSTPFLPPSPTPAHRVVASSPPPCPVSNSPSTSSPFYSTTDHSPSMVSVSPGTVIPLSMASSSIMVSSRPPSSPTSSSSSGSPPAFRLVVDLSNFDLQQVSHSSLTLPADSSRGHHMTLRPRQPKQRILVYLSHLLPCIMFSPLLP
jgi:histone deacetylase 1/2